MASIRSPSAHSSSDPLPPPGRVHADAGHRSSAFFTLFISSRIPCALGKHGSIACRQQQGVAVAKGNVECLGDFHQDLAAGNAAPAFDKTDVTLRPAGIER